MARKKKSFCLKSMANSRWGPPAWEWSASLGVSVRLKMLSGNPLAKEIIILTPRSQFSGARP